jgi:hypothetical protein
MPTCAARRAVAATFPRPCCPRRAHCRLLEGDPGRERHHGQRPAERPATQPQGHTRAASATKPVLRRQAHAPTPGRRGRATHGGPSRPRAPWMLRPWWRGMHSGGALEAVASAPWAQAQGENQRVTCRMGHEDMPVGGGVGKCTHRDVGRVCRSDRGIMMLLCSWSVWSAPTHPGRPPGLLHPVVAYPWHAPLLGPCMSLEVVFTADMTPRAASRTGAAGGGSALEHTGSKNGTTWTRKGCLRDTPGTPVVARLHALPLHPLRPCT